MTETTFEEALVALESKGEALSAGHLSLADAELKVTRLSEG